MRASSVISRTTVTTVMHHIIGEIKGIPVVFAISLLVVKMYAMTIFIRIGKLEQVLHIICYI